MTSIKFQLDNNKLDYLLAKIKETDTLEVNIHVTDKHITLTNKSDGQFYTMVENYDCDDYINVRLYFDDILLIKDCDLFKIRQVDCVPVEYCLLDENWEDYYQDMEVKRVAIEFKDINSTKVYVNRHIIEQYGYKPTEMNLTEEYIWNNTTINHDKVTDFLYERY